MGHADSLREICNGLACCLGKLVHLGIARAPNKSTLSYANQHRPAALYQDLFYAALARFRQQQGLGPRKHKFRFRNKLLSLDATIVSLCLTLFPWALCRRNKGGVKAHVLLDHDDDLPRYVLITPARVPDVRMAHALDLPKGSIVAMDRGYVDFRLFARWTEAGVFFLTRPLHHMVFEVLESRPVPEHSTLRSDQTIRFNSEWAQRHGFKLLLRRIAVCNQEHQQEIVLLTNHFGLAASTLAAIYKERWQIGVSSQGHINQPVQVRPRLTDSSLVAWEASWSESEMMKPSDKMLRKEYEVVFKTKTSRPFTPTGIRSDSTGMGGSKRRRTLASS